MRTLILAEIALAAALLAQPPSFEVCPFGKAA